MALTTFARKISKIIYFILLFLVLGRALPRPEIYLDYDIARDVCHFLFGSVNADTMYDTFFLYIADNSDIPFNCTLHYDIAVNFNDKEQMRCQFLRICGLKTMVAQT